MAKITFQDIKNDKNIRTYLLKGHEVLGAMGFTEHSLVHAGRVSYTAAKILSDLHYGERTLELAKIAGYMHDIGNVVGRYNHAQTGAILAFQLLTAMGMESEEIATVVAAIGNHDEGSGAAVNAVSAALILADKTDVRRSRVRNQDFAAFDIHDRVNYAVTDAATRVDAQNKTITLSLKIDQEICSVMDYFEIFLSRMMMNRRAAEFLHTRFSLVINGNKLL